MALSLDELESHMFECANIIRDVADPTYYKKYILPLVYYKSISDEFEKQHAENVEEYGEEFARRPNLYDVPVIPEGYLWEDIRATDNNVDQTLDEAIHKLTEKNLELKGAFPNSYINADALDDNRLNKLIEHLSKYNFARDNIPQNMLSEAYTAFIRRFTSGRKFGAEFFTPPDIASLCVKLVGEFEDGYTFHDPTVGSGGMLAEAARYYREEQDGDSSKLIFTGQDINPDITAIAKMNLSIRGLNASIKREDSLSSPQFTNEEENELTRFDRVLANFPFSADWAKDELQDDPYERFDWHEKLPRADRGDYAFIMHIAEQLKNPARGDDSGGKAAIVIPHGVLFREDEKCYREYMIEEDIVEAVVGLPERLFQNTTLPSAILVLNTDKPTEREGEVQFIHATDDTFYEESGIKNELTDGGISHIVTNFKEWQDEEGISRTVPVDEIRDSGYDLNISLYIDGSEINERSFSNPELTKVENITYDGRLHINDESNFNSLIGKLIQGMDNTVIVLGSYKGANKPELIRVKDELQDMGYDAHLYEDLPDFPNQDLSGSVATTMRLAGFCVMVDREASGHIDEYRIAEKQRTVLARLTREGGGSTRMIGGSEIVDVNYIKSFEFGLEPQEILDEAVEWAEGILDERREAYSEEYDWRD